MFTRSWAVFSLLSLMLISMTTLIQCETDATEDTEDVATDTTTPTNPTPPEPTQKTCSASGFTKIHDSMDICATCHASPSGDMPTLSDSQSADDNAQALKEHFTDGGALYDYIVSTPHGGHQTIKDEGIARTDYTPWCVE